MPAFQVNSTAETRKILSGGNGAFAYVAGLRYTADMIIYFDSKRLGQEGQIDNLQPGHEARLTKRDVTLEAPLRSADDECQPGAVR